MMKIVRATVVEYVDANPATEFTKKNGKRKKRGEKREERGEEGRRTEGGHRRRKTEEEAKGGRKEGATARDMSFGCGASPFAEMFARAPAARARKMACGDWSRSVSSSIAPLEVMFPPTSTSTAASRAASAHLPQPGNHRGLNALSACERHREERRSKWKGE